MTRRYQDESVFGCNVVEVKNFSLASSSPWVWSTRSMYGIIFSYSQLTGRHWRFHLVIIDDTLTKWGSGGECKERRSRSLNS